MSLIPIATSDGDDLVSADGDVICCGFPDGGSSIERTTPVAYESRTARVAYESRSVDADFENRVVDVPKA